MFCPSKYFWTFYVFGSCFRMLAVILVSCCFCLSLLVCLSVFWRGDRFSAFVLTSSVVQLLCVCVCDSVCVYVCVHAHTCCMLFLTVYSKIYLASNNSNWHNDTMIVKELPMHLCVQFVCKCWLWLNFQQVCRYRWSASFVIAVQSSVVDSALQCKEQTQLRKQNKQKLSVS